MTSSTDCLTFDWIMQQIPKHAKKIHLQQLDNKTKALLPWISSVSEMQIKDIFPHLSAPSDMSEHSSVFPNKAGTNRLSLYGLSENSHQGQHGEHLMLQSPPLLMNICGRHPDCDNSLGIMNHDAFSLNSLAKVKGIASPCLGLFSPGFSGWFNSYAALAPCDAGIWSILGLRGSGASSKRTRQWICSIGCVMLWWRAGVSTVANAVQPSQCCFSPNRSCALIHRQIYTNKRTEI